jgi:ribulose 1,5-bisphosphate synthetase/thiazole synthase
MTSAIPVMIVSSGQDFRLCRSTHELLQAGAGPAGLVLALTLSINGIAVRVVDLETKHRVGSKGYGISVCPPSPLNSLYAQRVPVSLARSSSSIS